MSRPRPSRPSRSVVRARRRQAARSRGRVLRRLFVEPLEDRRLLAGTPALIDIGSAPLSSNPVNFTGVDNIVFFTVNDGINGTELWKSDGTAAGTALVKDINLGAGSSY